MKQLHPSNCIGIRQFAEIQGCTDLYKVANNYVMVIFLYFVSLLQGACIVDLKWLQRSRWFPFLAHLIQWLL